MNNLNNRQNGKLELTLKSPRTTVELNQLTDADNVAQSEKPMTQLVIDGIIKTNDIDNLVRTGNEPLLKTKAANQTLDQSSRKPYIHSQPANWYQHNRFFKRYMLRELTAVPVALEAVNLFWGLYSLASNLPHWQQWVSVQASFLMVIFHLLVIIAALYNSYTWFAAMPKAVRLQSGEKFVSDKLLIGASWLLLLIIVVMLFAIVKHFSSY